MDLPNLLSKFTQPQEDVQLFVAVEIALSCVKTAIWQVYRGKTEIVALGTVETWDKTDTTTLDGAVRKSLVAVGSHFEESTKQVIFGLPEVWASADGVADERKPILKSLCQSLALKPVGFVVTAESMVHYLRDVEGGPPSAILIFVMHDCIVVTLARLGIVQARSQVVGRSDSIGADVEEGLARFPKGNTLPSRIVLYDGTEDLEHIRQELLTYDWQARLDFMHFPKVEILDTDDSIKAVALSGGAEVAKSLGLSQVMEEEAVPEMDFSSDYDMAEDDEVDEAPVKVVAVQPDVTQEPEEDPFDFEPIDLSVDDDVSGEVLLSEVVEDAHSGNGEIFPSDVVEQELVPVNAEEVFSHPEDEDEDSPQLPRKKRFTMPSLSSLGVLFRRKKPDVSEDDEMQPELVRHTKKRLPSFGGRRFGLPPLLLLGLLFLVLIGVGGFLFYWYVPKADVQIYVGRKSLEKPVSFLLDPERNGINLDTNTIPGELQELAASGTKQLTTTGSLVVGERAKGRVAVFNRTSSAKTLPAGTEIVGGGLTYTLDEEVRIASASSVENANLSITIEPAKQEVLVSAVAIGAEYNLSVDTEFSVANFGRDSFLARSVTDFTGGSSREVAAVSANDVETLEDALLNELAQEVTQKLTQQTEGIQAIVDDDQVIESQEFSHEIGDEADSLSLSMTVKQIVYTYDTKDLAVLAQQQVLAEIPDGFSLQPEATTIDVISTEIQEDGLVSIDARTQLKLVPDLDTISIARDLVGKYPPVTEAYFRSLPSYVRSEITIAPTLPSRLNTFPRSADRILITVNAVD